MTDFKWYSIVVALFALLWALIYLLFHLFNRSGKPVYRKPAYWLTCVIITPIVYLIGFLVLLSMLFPTPTDLTDKTITKGVELYHGQYDGLMDTDDLYLYDNGTFLTNMYDFDANGHYQFKNDSLHLHYSSTDEDIKRLPSFLLYKNGALRGYLMKNGQPDSSHWLYFSGSLNRIDSSRLWTH